MLGGGFKQDGADSHQHSLLKSAKPSPPRDVNRVRSFSETLSLLFKARVPVLYIESFEEGRVQEAVAAVASDAKRMRNPRPLWTWSLTRGIVGPDGKSQPGTTDPPKALDWILNHTDSGVFVFRDFHAHLGDGSGRAADAGLVRRLRDVAAAFQHGSAARVLLIVAPMLRIPPELEKDITIVDFPLPSEGEIRTLLDNMIATNSEGGRIRVEVDEKGRERIAKAAMGLTVHEAENAFARAMVDDGVLSNDDVQVVLEEKRQAIRKSGLLEFVPADIDLGDVGGLQNLKRWLDKRNNSWMAEAADYGLPAPKGLLMTGVPGCGKSLTAKAIASAWGLPLLRLDIGKVFAGLVGSSEQNMRNAIRAAEATAPCVLWIDEIEKGFSGAMGGAGDSGTSTRVFGSFLTWMQEKTSPVFVIATANNVSNLPPEFLRKGRFDEIFFVDLPTASERRDVWALHLRKRLHNENVAARIDLTESLITRLAAVTEGYAGAEIEQAVVAGLFDAFADRRPLTEADLFRAVDNMVPLSITQAEQIAAIRSWAATRAIAATAAEDRTGYGAILSSIKEPSLVGSALGASVDDPTDGQDGRERGGRLVDF
jgi:ATP-dependent 26S proteasome regulatory subunit